jgi:hypothetical protein
MPALIIRWKAVGVAVVVMSWGMVGWAQVSTPCPVLGTNAMVYGVESRSGAPYSATVKTTHDQKLSDGNAIHSVVETHQARDSAGRTWRETSGGCITGPDGRLQPVTHISVHDPTTRTTLVWEVNDPSNKVVRVYHQPEPAFVKPSEQTERPRQPTEALQQFRAETRHENLGSKTMYGVMADGSRTVRTFPPGEQGNNLPLEIVDEVWIAKDLGLAMLRINDDLRYGRTTTEVDELSRSEPDPALFVAPAAYKVEEQAVKPVASVGVQ